MKTRGLLTAEQYEILWANIKDMTYRDQQAFIKEHFGIEVTLLQCKCMRNNHHRFSNRTGWFQKGHVPFNKGKHVWADGCPESMKRTQFKPGKLPPNTRPIGYERVDKKDGYVYVKVPGKRKMVLKHRWVWEQAHGPIPKGYIIIFMNGDKTDCRLENLKMIPQSLNSIRNHNHLAANDKDLSEAGLHIAELIRKRSALKGGDANAPCKKTR